MKATLNIEDNLPDIDIDDYTSLECITIWLGLVGLEYVIINCKIYCTYIINNLLVVITLLTNYNVVCVLKK